MYIAHIRDEDNEEQKLLDHLNGTAILAREFAKDFNNEEYG